MEARAESRPASWEGVWRAGLGWSLGRRYLGGSRGLGGGAWVAPPSPPVPVTAFPSSIVQRGLYPGMSLRAPGGRFRGPQCASLQALAGPRGWSACVCVLVRRLWHSLVNPSLAQQPWPCLFCPFADAFFAVCGHCPIVCPNAGGVGDRSRELSHTPRISSSEEERPHTISKGTCNLSKRVVQPRFNLGRCSGLNPVP